MRQARTLPGSPYKTPRADLFDLSVLRLGEGDAEYTGVFNEEDEEREFNVSLSENPDEISAVENVWDGSETDVWNGVINVTLRARLRRIQNCKKVRENGYRSYKI